jgi:hypothetical protein
MTEAQAWTQICQKGIYGKHSGNGPDFLSSTSVLSA